MPSPPRRDAAALSFMLTVSLAATAARPATPAPPPPRPPVEPAVIALPGPAAEGTVSLEESLRRRRSVRSFSAEPLTLPQVSQLLWACQGVTAADGRRTAPSAGATYPLEIYLVRAEGLDRYDPGPHHLTRLTARDMRPALGRAAMGQESVLEAPAVVVIAAVFERTAARYGAARAQRYVPMEAGHAAQNLLLQAAALGLGAVPVGAFDDGQVASALSLRAGEKPLYLVPVGRPRAAR